MQQTEALDFPDAVELLADRYGVELEREEEDPQAEERRRRRERLLKLLERATVFYERYLWEAGEAAARAPTSPERGLGGGAARLPVGYAPSAWDRMPLGAQRDGFIERSWWRPGSAARAARAGLTTASAGADHVPAGRRARAGARLRGARRCARASGRST